MNHRADWFPIDRWLTDIESAVDEVIVQGQAMLDAHRANDEVAAQKAEFWHLDERHNHSRNHLLTMVGAFREIHADI